MKKQRVLSNFLILLSQHPLKNIFIKSVGYFWIWQNFFLFLAWTGLATVEKEDDFKQISYCRRKFAEQLNLKGLKMVSLGSSTHFATNTTCIFPFWKFDPAPPKSTEFKTRICFISYQKVAWCSLTVVLVAGWALLLPPGL